MKFLKSEVGLNFFVSRCTCSSSDTWSRTRRRTLKLCKSPHRSRSKTLLCMVLSFFPSKSSISRRFQSAFLYYSSGIVDVPTQAKMNEWRCANNDMDRGQPIPRKLLLFSFNSRICFSSNKKRDLDKEVVDMEDCEHAEDTVGGTDQISCPRSIRAVDQGQRVQFRREEQWADAGYHYYFLRCSTEQSEKLERSLEDQSYIVWFSVAGSASKPHNSHIILDKNQEWAYRSQAPRGISLYHTLLHEIGHILGLPHSFYRG